MIRRHSNKKNIFSHPYILDNDKKHLFSYKINKSKTLFTKVYKDPIEVKPFFEVTEATRDYSMRKIGWNTSKANLHNMVSWLHKNGDPCVVEKPKLSYTLEERITVNGLFHNYKLYNNYFHLGVKNVTGNNINILENYKLFSNVDIISPIYLCDYDILFQHKKELFNNDDYDEKYLKYFNYIRYKHCLYYLKVIEDVIQAILAQIRLYKFCEETKIYLKTCVLAAYNILLTETFFILNNEKEEDDIFFLAFRYLPTRVCCMFKNIMCFIKLLIKEDEHVKESFKITGFNIAFYLNNNNAEYEERFILDRFRFSCDVQSDSNFKDCKDIVQIEDEKIKRVLKETAYFFMKSDMKSFFTRILKKFSAHVNFEHKYEYIYYSLNVNEGHNYPFHYVNILYFSIDNTFMPGAHYLYNEINKKETKSVREFNNAFESNECAVCLNSFNFLKDKITILPCNHLFHSSCIKFTSCAICRATF